MQAIQSEPAELLTQGRVGIITLNRPEQGNALDAAMGASLARAIGAVAAEVAQGHVRCVLLCGRGTHFCVGGDIREFAAAGEDMPSLLDAGIPGMHATVLKLSQLPVPVVSALNGSVAGGGIGLALCGDLVLAAESMKLRGGYSAIGLTPDLGSSWALTRLAGPMRARHILLTNRAWSARRCFEAGLVADVYPDDGLMAAGLALADSLACGASGAQGRIKRLVAAAGNHTLENHLALEQQLMLESAATADAREGVHAFLDKRAPRFQ